MTDNQKFCTACGCNVSPNMQFCPQCGKVIEGSEASANVEKEREQLQAMVIESQRNFLFFALSVYAIPAIILGLFACIEAGHTADMIFSNSDFRSYYISHKWTFSVDDLKNIILSVGILEILSGACVAATMALVHKGVKRKIATLLCGIGAFLCIWSILFVFVGFLMTWNVYGSAVLFKDEKETSI